MASRARHTSPLSLYGGIALLLSLGGAIPLYIWLSWIPIVSWMASISLVTFLFYGFDKRRAKNGGSRVPEKVLHGLALVGGSVGGLGGMILFHHKTRKSSFQRVFRIIVVLQIAGVICTWFVIS